MPRTIEERLQEVLTVHGGFNQEAGRLLLRLLADFRAEGIAHRTIADSQRGKVIEEHKEVI